MPLIEFQSLQKSCDAGLSFFYPEICQFCKSQRATCADGYICVECRDQVRFIQPPFCNRCGLPYDGDITTEFQCSNCHDIELHFSFARSAVVANPFLLEIVHRYKYSRALWFEPFLAKLLVEKAQPILEKEQWDWIVPIPLHSLKKREREFNQAERLARQLSRATNIPIKTNLLRRKQFTRTQTQLTREQRMKNVQSAFEFLPDEKLHGERIVLLDDVLTTGATTSACAKILRKAGAGEICVWTVARGL
jgi:ComF family protein